MHYSQNPPNSNTWTCHLNSIKDMLNESLVNISKIEIFLQQPHVDYD